MVEMVDQTPLSEKNIKVQTHTEFGEIYGSPIHLLRLVKEGQQDTGNIE